MGKNFISFEQLFEECYNLNANFATVRDLHHFYPVYTILSTSFL